MVTFGALRVKKAANFAAAPESNSIVKFERVRASTFAAILLQIAATAAFASEVKPEPEIARDHGRILRVENSAATVAYTPQPAVLSRMMREGLLRFTGQSSVKLAWENLRVTPQDTVGIKVYSAPGANSGTRPAVAAAMVESLLEAGIPSQRIVIWDRRLGELRLAGFFELAEKYGVKVAGSQEEGYDPAIAYEAALLGRLVYGDLEFGKKGEGIGRKSHVSKLLTQRFTRVITLTPLLNHNLAGVSGVFWGLCMGSIDNLLRFELDTDRLGNALPEIYAMPEVGDKVVLNVVDALICQYQGEERTLLHYSAALNQLWFSQDPVAVDVLGIQELQRQRRNSGIAEARVSMSIYENAAILDLGVAEPTKLRLERVELK